LRAKLGEGGGGGKMQKELGYNAAVHRTPHLTFYCKFSSFLIIYSAVSFCQSDGYSDRITESDGNAIQVLQE